MGPGLKERPGELHGWDIGVSKNSHAKRPVRVERGSHIAAGLESREELP